MGQTDSQLVSEPETIIRGKSRTPPKISINARNMIKTSIASNDATTLEQLLSEEIYEIKLLEKECWLHKSVKSGQLEVVKTLVAYGISINSKDNHGFTPLHIAATLESKEPIKSLHKLGADMNNLGGKSLGKTALHLAIEAGLVENVAELLRCGSNPDVVSECKHGISPLLLATKGNSVEIVNLLLIYGANIHKCRVWKSTYNPPIDVLTHRLKDADETTARFCLGMMRCLLQGDCDLQNTLTLMPQGNHSRGTSQGSTLKAIKAIVRRLEVNSRSHALAFIHILLNNGYRPVGDEAMTYITTFDPIVLSWLQDNIKMPKTLKHLTVRVIRRNLPKNAVYGVSKLKITDEIKQVILDGEVGLQDWH